jgi:hypothetical protein
LCGLGAYIPVTTTGRLPAQTPQVIKKADEARASSFMRGTLIANREALIVSARWQKT